MVDLDDKSMSELLDDVKSLICFLIRYDRDDEALLGKYTVGIIEKVMFGQGSYTDRDLKRLPEAFANAVKLVQVGSKAPLMTFEYIQACFQLSTVREVLDFYYPTCGSLSFKGAMDFGKEALDEVSRELEEVNKELLKNGDGVSEDIEDRDEED